MFCFYTNICSTKLYVLNSHVHRLKFFLIGRKFPVTEMLKYLQYLKVTVGETSLNVVIVYQNADLGKKNYKT